jgi:HAD superfamily hydrolase (TIGR01549 family)
MTQITIKDHTFDVDAIVFDKDGTLIDLEAFWGGLAVTWVRRLVRDNGLDGVAEGSFYRTLGYNVATGRIVVDSPFAVASMWKVYNLLAVLLYQHGVAWHSAEQQVAALQVAQLDGEIRPIGNVTATLKRLAAAGIRIVIATSDDRATTQRAMQTLDLAPDLLVCGDDPLPNKPSPAVFAHIAATLHVDPSRMVMVGDSTGDMETGRNGSALAVVGIGAVAAADINIDSIDEILLVNG